LERLTSYESLTGLANRTLFYDQLASFIAFAKREKRKLPLLAPDVNAFKDVNDSLGDKVGDMVLREVPKEFRRSCAIRILRRASVAMNSVLFYRPPQPSMAPSWARKKLPPPWKRPYRYVAIV